MKRWAVVLLVVLAMVFCSSIRDAKAFGMGIYVEGSSGSATLTPEDEDDIDMDSSHVGLGLVMDTAIATRNVFNYRLKIGYDQPEYTYDYSFNREAKLECDSFILDNTFGFAMLRTPVARIWLGPELRLASISGELKVDGHKIHDIDGGGVGLGVAVGANFNLGPVVSLGIEGGYRQMYYFGTDDDDDSVDISDGQPFLGLSLLFRMGDRY